MSDQSQDKFRFRFSMNFQQPPDLGARKPGRRLAEGGAACSVAVRISDVHERTENVGFSVDTRPKMHDVQLSWT